MDEELLLDTVGRIYETVMRPDEWNHILADIARANQSSWGTYWVRSDAGMQIFGLQEDFAFLNDVMRESFYASEYIRRLDRARVGQPLLGTDLISVEEMRRSTFYHELGRKCHHVHAMLSVVCRTSNLHAAFGWSAGDGRDPYAEKDRTFLRALIPHVRRATAVGQSIADHRSAIRTRDAALDALSYGLILLDRHGKLLMANDSAESFLADARALGLRNGRLAAVDGEHRDALRELVDRCLGHRIPRPQGGGMRMRLGPEGRTITITGVPMPPAERTPLDYGECPAVLLVIVDLDRPSPEIAEVLHSAFALTATETRLVEALTHGETTGEYAEANNVRPDTVRKHLKTIFQKTDTKGQTDLVALASRLGIARR